MLLAVLAWLFVTSAPSSDPTTQIGVLATMLGSVGAIIAVVFKISRDGRRREKGEDTLAEQQQQILLDPMRDELARARSERDHAYADRDAARVERDAAWRARDKAWADRGVLMAVCLENEFPIPPEVHE